MKRLVLLLLVLVLVPQSASADGCTENCMISVDCMTGKITISQMTPEQIAARPIGVAIAQPPAEQANQPTGEPVNPIPNASTDTAVVQPTVETSTVIALKPQEPVLNLDAGGSKVVVNATTGTVSIESLSEDEIYSWWLMNWQYWFDRWSDYMSEYWSW